MDAAGLVAWGGLVGDSVETQLGWMGGLGQGWGLDPAGWWPGQIGGWKYSFGCGVEGWLQAEA